MRVYDCRFGNEQYVRDGIPVNFESATMRLDDDRIPLQGGLLRNRKAFSGSRLLNADVFVKGRRVELIPEHEPSDAVLVRLWTLANHKMEDFWNDDEVEDDAIEILKCVPVQGATIYCREDTGANKHTDHYNRIYTGEGECILARIEPGGEIAVQHVARRSTYKNKFCWFFDIGRQTFELPPETVASLVYRDGQLQWHHLMPESARERTTSVYGA